MNHSLTPLSRKTPVRVGVIGLGRFGTLHAKTLAGLEEAELTGVVARRQTSIETLQGSLPGIRGWTELDRAIEESGAEAWVVACSTSEHVRVTRRLLEAGRTVLLEKPISATRSEAESLLPYVASDSSNLMMGHIVLFNSEFRELRHEVTRRGRPVFMDCVRHRPASIVHSFPGENPLHAAMVHDLYLVQALMEQEEPISFSSHFHRHENGEIDLATATLGWKNGTLASFAASYLTPPGMPPRGFDRMEVFGNGWAARILPNPRPIEIWDESASWPMALEIRTDDNHPSGMMAEELRCFCRFVRREEPVPAGASFHDALQLQRWMDRLETQGSPHSSR